MVKDLGVMKIHAHILAYNEEKILPFILDYYSLICEKIFIYDNMSDDSSDEIYKRYDKVIVNKWDGGGKINEQFYLNIKNNAYKVSRNEDADWVIVCDCDEILYHPNLIGKLREYKENGITVPLVSGHDMVSENFPIYDGRLITEHIKIGSDRYEPFCKSIVFNPKLNVRYGIGAHNFTSDNTIPTKDYELMLLHYKLLGYDYIKNIYKKRAERLSEYNVNNGFGIHYFNPPIEYMDKLLKEKRVLI